MPCSPNDVSFPIPTGPSGPPIPGFGIPFVPKVPNINPFPDGFPEDLLDILNKIQFIIPPGVLKPALNPNFGKDIFDAIMKLLDQFFPFLMLYKFFLPVLNLIICIIEVLCALMNPFKLVSAINRLFNQCIPEFLNLFPVFALVIMIISLLLLLVSLVEYLLAQLLKFIEAILRNINALNKAFNSANATSVLAISKKLGSLLCIFQNFFVLLSLFNVIIEVIKDILGMLFSIPPCEDSSNGSTDGCCSPDVCPTIVKSPYTNTTGTFQYLNEVGVQTTLVLPTGHFNVDVRTESWQLLDDSQTIAQAFINIVDGYDIPPSVIPKPVFFPTDANYSATTNPKQAAYTIDLRLFYNPSTWGRTGQSRFIQFKDCIVLSAPIPDLVIYNNTKVDIPNGVLQIAGGLGYEDDGTTVLTGFAEDGTTSVSDQATLNNFLHMAPEFVPVPILSPTDGYTFSNMQYTFKPNIPVLLQKNLITLGCDPDVAMSRAFVNTVAFGDIALRTSDLSNLVNGKNGNVFPDPAATQSCLSTALSGLRADLTTTGVANFQAIATTCLQQLQNDAQQALNTVIGIGFNPCTSTFSITPSAQFTTRDIEIIVNLNDNNGVSLTAGLPVSVGQNLAQRITSYPTFGTVGQFSYDGYQSFIGHIFSDLPGSGQLMIGFDNQIFCTNTFGTSPSHALQIVNYQFIYSPTIPSTGEEDSMGVPRRDAGDIARDGGN